MYCLPSTTALDPMDTPARIPQMFLIFMCTYMTHQFRRPKLDYSQRSVDNYTPHVVLGSIEILKSFALLTYMLSQHMITFIRSSCLEPNSCTVGHRSIDVQSDRVLRGVRDCTSRFPPQVLRRRQNHDSRPNSPRIFHFNHHQVNKPRSNHKISHPHNNHKTSHRDNHKISRPRNST